MKIEKYVFICMIFSLFVINISAEAYSQNSFHFVFLEKEYAASRFCTIPLRELKNTQVREMLGKLKEQYPGSLHYEIVGESVQKRPIYLVRMGSGERKIMLWSQMHGDEPTSTAALFDVFNFLLQHEKSAFVQTILKKATILAVPMLNPDGAEINARRNAQGLDINRDARDLQTPEGRILYSLKESYHPDFGFNLHDQSGRITVGASNKLAAFAMMAPPYDVSNNDNPVRTDAKKVVSVIYQALGPYLYGHISKYKADYMPRAFGDSMQSWGVSTILLESGGWYHDRDNFLQKMNFIALMSAFHAIASGSYMSANPAIYDILNENDKSVYDLLIRDVTVIDGTGIPAYKIDVGINYDSANVGRIVDIGDLDFFAAKDTLDARENFMTPGFIGAIKCDDVDEKHLGVKLTKMVELGFTSILMAFSGNLPANIAQKMDSLAVPANLGGLILVSDMVDTLEIIESLKNGIVGIVGKDSSVIAGNFDNYTNKPVLPFVELDHIGQLDVNSIDVVKSLTAEQAELWRIHNRGKIRRGQIADFLLFNKNSLNEFELSTVFIKGHPAWNQGSWLNGNVKGDRWF